MKVSKTSIKGEIACCVFDKRALELGYVVSKPSVDCDYDRIIDVDGKLIRVQIKYSDHAPSCGTGAVVVDTSRTGNDRKRNTPYSVDDIDAVVAYIPQVDKLCWFDAGMWQGRRRLSLRIVPPKNNQTKGINFYKDFIW